MSHSHLNELFEQGLLWQAESVSGMERSHEPCGSGPSPDQPGLPDLPYSPGKEKTKSAVPFGVQEIDAVLPFNGLLRGGLHEFFYEDQKAANAGKKRNARDEKRSQPLYVLPGWIAAQALFKQRSASSCGRTRQNYYMDRTEYLAHAFSVRATW